MPHALYCDEHAPEPAPCAQVVQGSVPVVPVVPVVVVPAVVEPVVVEEAVVEEAVPPPFAGSPQPVMVLSSHGAWASVRVSWP